MKRFKLWLKMSEGGIVIEGWLGAEIQLGLEENALTFTWQELAELSKGATGEFVVEQRIVAVTGAKT